MFLAPPVAITDFVLPRLPVRLSYFPSARIVGFTDPSVSVAEFSYRGKMLPPTRTSPSGFQARTMPSHPPLRGSDARMARLSRDTLTRYATFFLSWSACAKKPWPEPFATPPKTPGARDWPATPPKRRGSCVPYTLQTFGLQVEPHSVGRKPAFRWPSRSRAFGMGSSVSACPPWIRRPIVARGD